MLLELKAAAVPLRCVPAANMCDNLLLRLSIPLRQLAGLQMLLQLLPAAACQQHQQILVVGVLGWWEIKLPCGHHIYRCNQPLQGRAGATTGLVQRPPDQRVIVCGSGQGGLRVRTGCTFWHMGWGSGRGHARLARQAMTGWCKRASKLQHAWHAAVHSVHSLCTTSMLALFLALTTRSRGRNVVQLLPARRTLCVP